MSEIDTEAQTAEIAPEKPESSERTQRPKKGRRIVSILFSVFIAICILLIAFNIYVRVSCVCVVVSGDSMNTTLTDGDVIFVRKSAEPKRGDIVVIDVTGYENDRNFTGDYIIKRVVATAGDSLYCEDHTLYIRYAGAEEYVSLTESYIDDTTGNTSFRTVTVGEGEVFVLGDNRGISYDSRYIGCVKTDIVVGPVVGWSLSLKGAITAYYDFFGLKPEEATEK